MLTDEIRDAAKRHMERQNMTVYRFARDAGLPLETARRWLRGTEPGRGATLNAVAAFLGIKVRRRGRGRTNST